MNPFDFIRQLISPWTRASSAPKVTAEPGTPEERRAKYDEDRQKLVGETRWIVILLVALLVLTLEYTPMVVADYQVEQRYADQVRSLVLVEGNATALDRLIDEGSAIWVERVETHIARALRKIDELDRFNRQEIPMPAFLRECSEDEDVAGWVDSDTVASGGIESHWREIVERCIVEPMGPRFDEDDRDRFRSDFFAITGAMKTAVAGARVEFPGTPTPPVANSCDPGRPPVPLSTTGDAHSGLDAIESELFCIEELFQLGPYASSPPPGAWANFYAGTTGSLRSFRDNIFFAFAKPYGAAPAPLPERREPAGARAPGASTRLRIPPSVVQRDAGPGNISLPAVPRDTIPRGIATPVVPRDGIPPSAATPVVPRAIFLRNIPPTAFQRALVPRTISFSDLRNISFEVRQDDVAGRLGAALDPVIQSQTDLQEKQAARFAYATENFPEWLKPVAAILRPKYLVLGYPIALAVGGTYLLANYMRLWRTARHNGFDGANAFAPLLFALLVGVPLLSLIGLFRNYDWPQFAYSSWQWFHRAPIVALIAIAIGCLYWLRDQTPKKSPPASDATTTPASPATTPASD